jgi:hypothetical protein
MPVLKASVNGVVFSLFILALSAIICSPLSLPVVRHWRQVENHGDDPQAWLTETRFKYKTDAILCWRAEKPLACMTICSSLGNCFPPEFKFNEDA